MKTVNDVKKYTRINIAGDEVRRALDRLAKSGVATMEAINCIRWFYNHAMDAGMGWRDAAQILGVDAAAVYALLCGRYAGDYDAVTDKIDRYRAKCITEEMKCGYVETSTWERVSAVCRHARVMHKAAIIYGASQIGKTSAFEEMRRRDMTGLVKLIRMPAAPTLARMQIAFAQAFNLSLQISREKIRSRIIGAITPDTLIMVDEVHQAIIGASRKQSVKVYEWMREVQDLTKCGMVYAGTNVFRDELEMGKMAGVLDQFRRRGCIPPLRLPDTPPMSDIVKIAAAFGLGAPEGDALDIAKRMIASSGLGQYVSFLQSAKNIAANKKQEIVWRHFVMAYDTIQSLSLTPKE